MRTVVLDRYTVERPLPCNLQPGDLPLFGHERQKSFGPVHLETLRSAFILNDLVFKPFRFYVDQSLSFRMGRREQVKRLVHLLRPGPKFERAVWVLDDWSLGYFHWFTDALPRLFVCLKHLHGHPVLLPETYRQYAYITDSLDRLGQPFLFYDGACRVGELLLPDHVSVSGNYHEPTLQAVRAALLGNKPASRPHRRIYISRQFAHFRKLKQEDAFTAMLGRFGFETHYFETYSLDEQIRLMQETSHCIGLHGGGLTNILFQQAGTRVLELRFPGDGQNNCYYSLAAACGVDYYYLTGSQRVADTHTDDLLLDLEAAEAALRQLLDG